MIISNAIAARLTVVETAPVEPHKPPTTAPTCNRTTDARASAQATDSASTATTSEPTSQTDDESPDLNKHFQRGLGAYPLRNRSPTALLTVREAASNPD
eukprot:4206763-Pleurochrysis_carterae.AAC.1